jgi:arsenite-transporting ATPase
MRIIFFAGKGGVGKTSASAATGMAAARQGSKTLVLSLDTAHSLADIFDLDRGLLDQNKGQPIPVADNLWIQELDIGAELASDWGEIHQYITKVLNATGIEEILAEELAILPGMEEISLLLKINRYVQEKAFDTIILDSAPTGEAVRFISLPTALEWYMKKFFNLERKLMKVARPVVQKMTDVPLPDDRYFESIKTLFERLKGVDEVLTDPAVTTVRLVTNPEKIVLKETQRAFMYFTLYRMHIDAVIINRVLPDKVKDKYFASWQKSQKKYIALAERYFAPLPLFLVDLFPGEVLGAESLDALGRAIYKEKNPLAVLHSQRAYELKKEDGQYCLSMRLAFADKPDIAVSRNSTELIVRLGSFRRHILLPGHVAAAKKARAKFAGDTLTVYFS